MNTEMMPWIIAHRGASKERRENTLAAFQRAIEIGAHCLEVDVHLSKDGVPICHHDAALGPNCSLLSELSVKDIKNRTADKGEAPTLEQLLGLVRGDVQLFIELKSDGCHSPRRLVEAVTDLLPYYQHCANQQPFIGSFSITMLRELRKHWPAERTVGIAEFASEVAQLAELKPAVIAMEAGLAQAERVRALIDQDISVWTWTVDDVALATSLLNIGVSGIITNDPSAFTV